MTDKQIIIDDCIHLKEWKHCDICEKLIKTKDGANGKKREHLLTVGDLKCDFYPNCYYKQHKRDEQRIVELNKTIKAKEQECEELKKEVVNLKLNLKKVINLSQKKNRQCYQFLADIKQFKAENKHLNNLLNQALKELEELQEGLENG